MCFGHKIGLNIVYITETEIPLWPILWDLYQNWATFKQVLYHDIHNIYMYIKYIDGLVQDCSVSSSLAMEIMQYCTKPLIYT